MTHITSWNGWSTNPTDANFPKLIKKIIKRTQDDDDDFLLMCVGETGTGKSSLMFWAYWLYDQLGMNLDVIGFDQESNADALLNSPKKPTLRFVGNDEANIMGRNALSKYNKQYIDLMFAIRGLNIFQWWNNPSLDIIDKVFINEKINGIIFIANKDTKHPRIYYYFTKKQILNILERNKGKLTLKILKNSAKKHSTWRGWFNKYDGKLWKEYIDKKHNRMQEKLESFSKNFGKTKSSLMTFEDAGKSFNVSGETIHRRLKKYIKKELLNEGEHYIITGTNRLRLTKGGFEAIIAIEKGEFVAL